jgi:hypothetical protein
MASVTVTPIDVRPLNGNVTINAVVGGAMSIGDAAYIAADGDWERADADAAATAMVAGICVSTPRTGVTDAVAGDRCDFVPRLTSSGSSAPFLLRRTFWLIPTRTIRQPSNLN